MSQTDEVKLNHALHQSLKESGAFVPTTLDSFHAAIKSNLLQIHMERPLPIPGFREAELESVPRIGTKPIRDPQDAIKRMEDNLMDMHDLMKEHGFTPALQAMIDDTFDILDYLKK